MDVQILKKGQEDPVYSQKVSFQPSFGAVVGEPLLMVSETLQIQIAVNSQNMSDQYGIQAGPDWTMKLKKC